MRLVEDHVEVQSDCEHMEEDRKPLPLWWTIGEQTLPEKCEWHKTAQAENHWGLIHETGLL